MGTATGHTGQDEHTQSPPQPVSWLLASETHQRHALVDVITAGSIEHLALMGVQVIGRQIICHHDHDVVIIQPTLGQHLVSLPASRDPWILISA